MNIWNSCRRKYTDHLYFIFRLLVGFLFLFILIHGNGQWSLERLLFHKERW